MEQEAVKFLNISATTAAFSLTLGGNYDVAVHATWGGGNVHLQQLLPDGASWVDVGSSTNFTADGTVVVVLAPGAYRFTVTTATAVYVVVARAPVA